MAVWFVSDRTSLEKRKAQMHLGRNAGMLFFARNTVLAKSFVIFDVKYDVDFAESISYN